MEMLFKIFTKLESNNIINEFQKATMSGYIHYNLSIYNLCNNHLTFDPIS